MNNPKAKISSFLKQYNYIDDDPDKPFRGKYMGVYTVQSITKAPFIVFYANRIFIDSDGVKKRTNTEIIPDPTFYIDKNKYSFYSVVIHESAHYTCYIKCGKEWFYYNDMPNTIVPVGDYDTMLKERNRPNVKSRGILYFYRLD